MNKSFLRKAALLCAMFQLICSVNGAAINLLFSSPDCLLSNGSLEYTQGVGSPAGIFGGKHKAVFTLNKNFNADSWGVSLWVKPLDWQMSTQNFVFFMTLQGSSSNRQAVDLMLCKFCKRTDLAFNLRSPESHPYFHRAGLWQKDSWHQLAVTFQRGQLRYFLDGQLIKEQNQLPTISWKNLVIGTPYSSWGFIGSEKSAISRIKLFTQAPSPDDIHKEYLQGCALVAGKQTVKSEPVDLKENFDLNPPSYLRSTGRTAVVPGISGNGMLLSNGTVSLPTQKIFAGRRAGTVALWVKPQWHPSSEKGYFFTLLSTPDQQLLLYKPHKSHQLRLYFRDLQKKTQKWVEKDIRYWQKDQWHHLAFTWNEQQLFVLYIDGKSVGSMIDVPPFIPVNAAFGKVLPGWGGLGSENTVFDDLLISSRELSASEIQALYQQHRSAENPAAKKKSNTVNLAAESRRCIVTASSFADYASSYTNNLCDNDLQTFWQTREPGESCFLELRWPFPRQVDTLQLDGLLGNIKEASLESYSAANNTWTPVKRFDSQQISSGCFTFPQQSTTRLRLHLQPSSGEYVAASELSAYGPVQSGTSAAKPYWDAWYIWYNEPDKVHKPAQKRYFRKIFTLDQLPENAVLQARSNDYYKLFINGAEVDSGSVQIHPCQVQKYLKKGKNVIAAEADLIRNPGQWGWGEFIAELSLNYPDKSIRIGTGSDWKSSPAPAANWNSDAENFDERSWQPSYCYKRPPEGPWGKIAYYPSGVCEKASTVSASLLYRGRPGETLQLKFQLQTEFPLKQDYDFLLEAGSLAGTLRSKGQPFAAMYGNVKSSPDQRQLEITADFTLPAWSPSGKQKLYLSAQGRKDGQALSINGVDKYEIAQIKISAPITAAPNAGVQKAQIAYVKNQAAFLLDDQVHTPFFWRYMHLTDPERLFMTSKYSDIKIHQFLLYGNLIDADRTRWGERFAELDNNIKTLLSVAPQSLVVVLWDMRPTLRWLQKNPDEMLITASGKKDGVSFASKKYRQECLQFSRALIEFLQKQPYYKHIVGFHPWICGMPDSVTGGVSENLWQTDRSKLTVGDFNLQAIDAFREFLRQRYNNDVDALRKAWKKPEVTFDNAAPEISELTRSGLHDGVFRDPAQGCMTFDYMDFVPTMMSSLLLDICRQNKRLTANRCINFVHYGFVIAHMQGYNTPGGIFNNNNFDLPELLKDPAIDGYVGAASYSGRLGGTAFITYFPWSSFKLHGRMYLLDDDTRYYHTGTRNYGHTRSLRESRAILQRNLGADITRNLGAWFADMSRGEGVQALSWTGTREITGMLARMDKLYRQAQADGYRSAAEIAVIFSTESPRYLDFFHGPTLANNLINWMFYPEFFKLGAPFDVYMTSDLHHRNFPRKQYKLYVMMNCFYLSDADRQKLNEFKQNNTTFLWFYAPGYIRKNALDVKGITELTGIETVMLPGKEKMSAAIGKHFLTANLPPGSRLAAAGFTVPATQRMHSDKFGPRFRIVDKQAEIAARFADGQGALAFKNMGSWRSVYSVIPRLEQKVLRNICRSAGVHIYTQEGIAFDANKNYIVMHNGYESPRDFMLYLPQRCTVSDALSNKELARNCSRIRVKMEPCSTLIYRLTDFKN
ncbi:MAG: hypothetical protein E7052_09665 [Lentisphaerae bacterium]|nr:hypothetical protein [Lentisphaerota bacterium]